MVRVPTRRDVLGSISWMAGIGALGRARGAASRSEGGEELWRFGAGARVDSSPTIVDGTVYVGNSIDSLFAVDAETGDQQWRFRADGDVRTAPQVIDGTVYVGSYDANVYAVDAETGEEVWHFETGDEVNSSPTVAGGTLFVGSDDGIVYALDADTGEEAWRFETDAIVRSSPTVVDGAVFVACQNTYVYALDAATGEVLWRFDTGNAVEASPTVAAGTVFVSCAESYERGDQDTLFALDAATGAVQWRASIGGSADAAATVLDGTVYVRGRNEALNAVDADTGEVQWRYDTGWGYGNGHAPTVADGVVFQAGRHERITAVDASTGEEMWNFVDSGPRAQADSHPTVANGTVYVGSFENLLAIDAGVDGSSEGSRVRLRTLGHTGTWTGRSDQTTDAPDLEPAIEHLRLVQTVEHTRAVDPDPDLYERPGFEGAERPTFTRFGPASEALVPGEDHPWITWTGPEPAVVAGRRVAPVFDLRVDAGDDRAIDSPLEVTAQATEEGWDVFDRTVELSEDAVAGRSPERREALEEEYRLDAPDRLPLLDVLAAEDTDHLDAEYPTFPAAPDLEVEVQVDGAGLDDPVTERVSLDRPTELGDTLRIGVVGLEHEGTYAFEEEPDLVAFAEDLARYALATFPTRTVAIAVLPTPHRSDGVAETRGRAAGRAEQVLWDRLDEARTFAHATGGQRIEDYEVRGVDVTLGVMPDDWGYEGGGVLPTSGVHPIANAALTRYSRGATTAAHEAGHYFLGIHYADRSIPDQGEGGIHVSETVACTGFDLQAGDLEVLPGRGSVMGGDSPLWTDAATYNGLLDSEFQAAHEVVGGVLAGPYDADTAGRLATVESRTAALDRSSLDRTDTDVDDLHANVVTLRTELDAAVDGAERYWEAPEELPAEWWEQLREVAADVVSLGEELQSGEPAFVADREPTTDVLGRRLAATGSSLADRAETRLDRGVEYVLEITGVVDDDVDLDAEVVPVVGPIQPADGEGTAEVRDADGDVLERVPVGTTVDLIGQDGSRERLDRAVVGAVALPDDAATVEITADADAGSVSTRIDPTTDPIGTAVEALPDRAFDDAGARGDALATLDRIGDLVAGGDHDAAADRLQALYRDLEDAIRESYEPEAADEPTGEAVLARVGQQIQRFGGEVGADPGDGDESSTTWLLGVGGAAVGAYALKRLRTGDDAELSGE